MSSFIERLRVYDEDTIQSLDDLPVTDMQPAMTFLMHSGRQEDVSLLAAVFRSLAKRLGRHRFQGQIRDEWPHYSAATRRNIVFCFADSEGPSNDLAEFVFDHVTATVEERHLTAAGLSATAKQRGCENVVLDMCNRIGTYEDQAKQRTLEGFIQDARRAFSGT